MNNWAALSEFGFSLTQVEASRLLYLPWYRRLRERLLRWLGRSEERVVLTVPVGNMKSTQRAWGIDDYLSVHSNGLRMVCFWEKEGANPIAGDDLRGWGCPVTLEVVVRGRTSAIRKFRGADE